MKCLDDEKTYCMIWFGVFPCGLINIYLQTTIRKTQRYYRPNCSIMYDIIQRNISNSVHILWWLTWTILLITVRADVKISGSKQKFVAINKQIHLTCQYNASPPVSEVQWVKDGSVIARNDSGIGNGLVNITEFTESQSQLLISSSTRNDEGDYTCFVTNAVGNSSDITSVVIQGMFFSMIYNHYKLWYFVLLFDLITLYNNLLYNYLFIPGSDC